jgi:hypothetical protein
MERPVLLHHLHHLQDAAVQKQTPFLKKAQQISAHSMALFRGTTILQRL